MNETEFFELMNLQPQEITDTQYFEMMSVMNKNGFNISEWGSFQDAETVEELKDSILECVMQTYKWKDIEDNANGFSYHYNYKIREDIAKVFGENE